MAEEKKQDDHRGLDGVRGQIDAIDAQMQTLFEERMRCVREVAEYKAENGLPIFVPEREHEIIARRVAEVDDRSLAGSAEMFFHTLMDLSKEEQRRYVLHSAFNQAGQVAFQGVRGAFSEEAVVNTFGECATPMPCPQFQDVIAAVEDGTAAYGVLPIENSTGGAINEVYDLLGVSGCMIVGECIVHVHQCLMGLPGSSIDGIRSVYSHPQGLRQCRHFLDQRNWMEIPYYDTAASAAFVRETGDASIAAIASRRAAEHYGLELLAPPINDRSDNYTRFVVISLTAIEMPGKGKASMAFTLKNADESGSLHAVLTHMATRQFNMTKLESRNIPGDTWEYRFYVDFEGDVRAENIAALKRQLSIYTKEIQVLGCYEPAKRG